MHIPALISDLALMLIVAGVTTVLFVKIKQPLVLGYILAGFLTGPYFHLLPGVHDMVNIHTWSEIGIIFLMFSLGLEFNLHKLASVGNTAIITALTEVAGMLSIGFVLGQLMGWSIMDSVFLGGVLSMSSTTIIIKAFEELKLKGQRFTDLVFGSLIVEDIAGIFMMIILSTIAASSGVTGGMLAQKLLLMLLYLAMWLMLGIYLIPTLLKKIQDIVSDEMLLIVSIGMCLGMVMLADTLGFSSALGAFLAGSLLAGTIHAERVEHLTKPVKDLFGAVFFISVGMLVDPALLMEYIIPVLLITAATIVGKVIFSTGGMLLSGQSLNTSLHSGFSLAQIGEFAFIITALGASLQVTSDFLYPIVVCVSVITTLTTPFLIRLAEPFHGVLNRKLPGNWLNKLNRYTSDDQSEKEQDSEWQQFIRHYFSRLFMYAIPPAGIIVLSEQLLFPLLCRYMDGDVASMLATALTLLLLAPFLRQLLSLRSRHFARLWLKSRSNRPPLIVLYSVKLLLSMFLIGLPVQQMYNISPLWLLVFTLGLTFIISRSDLLASSYLQVEARFLCNFNERNLALRAGEDVNHRWLDEHIFVCHIENFRQSGYVDKPLIDLRWGERFGVNLIKIVRGKKHINIPAGTERLREGDALYVMGSKPRLDNFLLSLGRPVDEEQNSYPSLHDFIETAQDNFEQEDQLLCCAVTADRSMKIIGLSIKEARLKDEWSCFVIGLERDLYPLINPSHNMLIKSKDLIWVLGTQKMAARLARADLLGSEDEDMAAGGVSL